jgi:hypothetical protein
MNEKKKVTAEDIAEETGKFVGKGFKKGVKIVKAFVEGAEDSLKDKKKK